MNSTKDSEAAAKAVAGVEASSLDESSGPKARVVIQQCLSAKLLVRPASEASPELSVQVSSSTVASIHSLFITAIYIAPLQGYY